MSEVTKKLEHMLAQAQGFSEDAPLEALSRARLALREADAALAGGATERERLVGLRAIAASRVEAYEKRLAGWTETVQKRADLFESNEQDRLAQAIPSKL